MAVSSSEKGWRFGTFELDAQFRELHNHGTKIKLTPQVYSALALLVENAGEVVPRDELCRTLWPDGIHVDFEGNLNAIIGDVRAALGDSARRPRYIETEPKKGYRFIAPVSPLVPSPPSAPLSGPPSEPAVQHISKTLRRFLLPAAIALFVLIAFFAAVKWVNRDTAQTWPKLRITQFTN